MTEKTITKSQYYQLIGLKTLAEKHNNALEEIIESMAEILDARDNANIPDGYITDTVYSNLIGLDSLLNRLEIEVEA